MSELYLDYNITRQDRKKDIELMVVAILENYVDSYLELTKLLGLEVVQWSNHAGSSDSSRA